MSKVNQEATYIFDVDGETVWERLRCIRNFLEQRRLAYNVNKLAEEKALATMEKDSWEFKEYLIHKEFNADLMEDCELEIKFLEEFEAKLAAEAEKTRIFGKTDKEMYDINYFEEHKLRLIKTAQSQFVSTGRIEAGTLLRLIKCKPALEMAIQLNLLVEEAIPFISQVPCLSDSLLLDYKEQKQLS